MRLQSLVEVCHTHGGVDDGQYDEDDGNDGEECQGSSGRQVFPEPVGLIHPDELEKEICHGGKVEKLE